MNLICCGLNFKKKANKSKKNVKHFDQNDHKQVNKNRAHKNRQVSENLNNNQNANTVIRKNSPNKNVHHIVDKANHYPDNSKLNNESSRIQPNTKSRIQTNSKNRPCIEDRTNHYPKTKPIQNIQINSDTCHLIERLRNAYKKKLPNKTDQSRTHKTSPYQTLQPIVKSMYKTPILNADRHKHSKYSCQEHRNINQIPRSMPQSNNTEGNSTPKIKMKKFAHEETCIDSSSNDENSLNDNDTRSLIGKSNTNGMETLSNASNTFIPAAAFEMNSNHYYSLISEISTKEDSVLERSTFIDSDGNFTSESETDINETMTDEDENMQEPNHELYDEEITSDSNSLKVQTQMENVENTNSEQNISITNNDVPTPEISVKQENQICDLNPIPVCETTENDSKRFSVASAASSDFSYGPVRGLNNPKGYCFLNSVMQVLRSCQKFNSGICKYHEQSKIENTKEQDDSKKIFVINFCNLFYKLKTNKSITMQLNEIQNYFISSSSGDDVNKCFMNLLSIVNDVTKDPKPGENNKSDAEKTYQTYKNMNYGIVFDCFYGLLSYALTCEKCKCIISNRFQLMKSLSLPVPETNKVIKLEKCLKLLFEKSKVDVEDAMKCRCLGGTKDVSLVNQIAIGPKYLFIYLDRGSFLINGQKKTTFVKCSNVIWIRTTSKKLQYKLISVIDHIGTNVNGHYFCKCNYEKDNWFLLNDTEYRHLGPYSTNEIVTENSIAFMFKKIEQRVS